MKGADRENSVVYIGIGSNLGDLEANLAGAINAMEESPGIEVSAVSGVYHTQPVDNKNQPDFLNQVVSIGTRLAPRDLLAALHGIEKRFGRERSIWKGPRTLDLDILLYDDLIVDEPDLRIPHPELLNRPFFMRMVLEIAPDIIEPVSNRPLLSFFDEMENGQNGPNGRNATWRAQVKPNRHDPRP